MNGLRWYAVQVSRGASRFFNALIGGEGDTTISAYSYYLALQGRRRLGIPARYWVRVIDHFLGEHHCLQGYTFHRERRLFERNDY